MILESIRIEPKGKKLLHYKDSGVQELKLKNKGNEAVSEGIQYTNDYATKNGFKLVNTTTMDAGTVFYIIYDLV